MISSSAALDKASSLAAMQAETTKTAQKATEAREVFDKFVGQTFYGQTLKALRSSQGKPAYFHGGRAEEIFQGQLDQMLAEKMSDASAKSFTGSMFDQFEMLSRLGTK